MAAKAPARRKQKVKEEEVGVHTTPRGFEIPIKKIDPIFVQGVVNSVKIPEPPTYETRLSSGRIETHRMDLEAAEQTDGGMEIWNKYQEEFSEAQLEKANRSLKAIFLDGTTVPETDWMDANWERRMQIVGVDLPEDEEELWVMFLTMYLTAEEINGLTAAIMRLTGIGEEYIEAAQESFRDSVLPDGESEALAES